MRSFPLLHEEFTLPLQTVVDDFTPPPPVAEVSDPDSESDVREHIGRKSDHCEDDDI